MKASLNVDCVDGVIIGGGMMKRSNRVARMFLATLSTLTLVTFDQATLAATTSDSPNDIQVEAAATRNAPAQHRQDPAIANSPLALIVQTPGGSTLRLTYVPDDGWKFDDDDAGLKPTEGRITPAAVAQLKDDAITNRPLTVFIDGPTGYTYVWMRDRGWKFIGHITGHIN